MQSIYYIRHGESESNTKRLVSSQTDSPLSEIGKQQAIKAAEWASGQGLRFDIIISSPLSRSLDTAKIIARKLNYPTESIEITDNLKERDCGDFEGQSLDIYHNTPESDSIKNHGVEPLEALYERAMGVLEWIKKSYPNKTILIVSHSGIGKMLQIIAAGRKVSEFDKTVSLPNATIMRLI